MIQRSDFLTENENKVKYFQDGILIDELTMIEALQLQIFISENGIKNVTFLGDVNNQEFKMLPNGCHERQPPMAFTQLNKLLSKWTKSVRGF